MANQGVTTFSGLTLTTAASGDTLVVSGTSLGDAVTSAITVTPAAPAQVVVTQQPPSSVTAGSGFGLQAAIEDAYGNVVTSAVGTVSVAGEQPRCYRHRAALSPPRRLWRGHLLGADAHEGGFRLYPFGFQQWPYGFDHRRLLSPWRRRPAR